MHSLVPNRKLRQQTCTNIINKYTYKQKYKFKFYKLAIQNCRSESDFSIRIRMLCRDPNTNPLCTKGRIRIEFFLSRVESESTMIHITGIDVRIWIQNPAKMYSHFKPLKAWGGGGVVRPSLPFSLPYTQNIIRQLILKKFLTLQTFLLRMSQWKNLVPLPLRAKTAHAWEG